MPVELALPDHLFALALLREVPSADRDLVRAASRMSTFQAGEAIYRQGMPSRSLALLVAGRAKLCVPSAHGKELVVSLLEPGQSFGEIGFLDGQPRSLDAMAILPSRVVTVKRAALLDVMARTPRLALAFAEATCKRLRRTTASVQQAVFYGVEERLADCLLQLAAASGNPAQGVPVPVCRVTVCRVTVWQHELAAMVGVSRESINKQLRAWHARHLIGIGRGYIDLIDPSGLPRIGSVPMPQRP